MAQRKVLSTLIITALCSIAFNAHAQIKPGKGMFIDDVSYDMGCSGDGACQSITERLQQYGSNQMWYLFPDFGYIDRIPAVGESVIIDSQCNGRPPIGVAATYNAMPMISPLVLSEPSLGTCQPGTTITAHYHINNNYRVLPLFTAANSSMFTNASPAQLQQFALALAKLINNDPNAAGIAFDIEPAFKQGDTTLNFYGTLAKALEPGKILAIFDANRDDLAAAVVQLKLDNVLVLQALYDFGVFGLPDSQAIPLETEGNKPGYAAIAKQYAKAYFGDGSQPQMNIPVMFVLPGSATSSIWDSLQFYNTSLPAKGPINPYKNSDVTATHCFANPPSWLSQFLTAAPGHQPSEQGLAAFFVSAQNCLRYDNPQQSEGKPVKFIQYFNAALNAVNAIVTSLPASQQAVYIGSALYTTRAAGHTSEAYNDINCAKHYYSTYYTSSLLKQCIGVFPSNISDTVLQTFIHGSQM